MINRIEGFGKIDKNTNSNFFVINSCRYLTKESKLILLNGAYEIRTDYQKSWLNTARDNYKQLFLKFLKMHAARKQVCN